MEKKSSCPRKLDLNAPFLSTRRIELPRLSSRRPSWDTCNRVPFSWEQTPGKPKGGLKTYDEEHIHVLPPKLPPCRWHPPAELENTHNDSHDSNSDPNDDHNRRCNEEDFSDAIDLFSLSESVDFFDRHVDDFDTRVSSTATQSPSFIIQRYLSDAEALAAASSAVIPASTSTNNHSSRTVGQSYSSPKSCGLHIFFPWRMKHKLCGVKTPVNPTRRKHSCSLAQTQFDSCRY